MLHFPSAGSQHCYSSLLIDKEKDPGVLEGIVLNFFIDTSYTGLLSLWQKKQMSAFGLFSSTYSSLNLSLRIKLPPLTFLTSRIMISLSVNRLNLVSERKSEVFL